MSWALQRGDRIQPVEASESDSLAARSSWVRSMLNPGARYPVLCADTTPTMQF